MARNYAELEQKIIAVFDRVSTFEFEGQSYRPTTVGKPTTRSGECKTDVYVQAESECQQNLELKISVKTRSSNEFQENKLTAEKAEAYFGPDWSRIIKETSESLAQQFSERKLIHLSSKHPIKANSITLGWKLEIADRARSLSTPLALNEQQVKEFVYKGINQPQEKKDASVNGREIANSGVADYIIYTELDEIQSVNDVLTRLELIDSKNFNQTYLIFTANNYRTDKQTNPSDGPRSLAVYIDWSFENGKLHYEICYDRPLEYKGQSDIQPQVQRVLQNFGLIHPHTLSLTLSQLTQPDILNP